jgi:hypothetical protein
MEWMAQPAKTYCARNGGLATSCLVLQARTDTSKGSDKRVTSSYRVALSIADGRTARGTFVHIGMARVAHDCLYTSIRQWYLAANVVARLYLSYISFGSVVMVTAVV